jgi:cell division protein DivIC
MIKKRRGRIALAIIALAFIVYVVHASVNLGTLIEKKSAEVTSLEKAVEEQRLINEELQRTLDMPIDSDYVERIARDKLGLAYPNERVFINVDGN